MSMQRITKMQNEIAGLQATLAERNKQIATLNAGMSAQRETILKLTDEVKELQKPKPTESVAA